MDKDPIFQLCDIIRETGFAIHQYLGPGHAEKIYQNALVHRLTKRGIRVETKIDLEVFDEDGTSLGTLEADVLIERQLIVEVKAAKTECEAYTAQLLGYLRASRLEHGLLLNFGGQRFFIKKYILSRLDPGSPGPNILPGKTDLPQEDAEDTKGEIES